MKKYTERICILLLSAILLTSICVAAPSYALQSDNGVYCYYGERLSGLAETLYNVIDEMRANKSLMTGVESHNVTDRDVLLAAQSYAKGDKTLINAFNQAADSYAYDHPEVFYVDFNKLSLSVKKQGKELSVSIGAGRNADYYIDGSSELRSPSAIEAAVTKAEEFVHNIVGDVTDKTPEDVIRGINSYLGANKNIIKQLSYGYGNGSDGTAAEASLYVDNLWGACRDGHLVNSLGYAKLFKAVMDYARIPCIVVKGYLADGDSFKPHFRNYVNVNSFWYAVDVMQNDVSGNDAYCLLLGAEACSNFLPCGSVSHRGDTLTYPELSDTNFDSTEGYLSVNPVSVGGSAAVTVSYNGKSALTLTTGNNRYYMAYRRGTTESIKEQDYRSVLESDGFTHTSTETSYRANGDGCVQFAVFSVEAANGTYTKEEAAKYLIEQSDLVDVKTGEKTPYDKQPSVSTDYISLSNYSALNNRQFNAVKYPTLVYSNLQTDGWSYKDGEQTLHIGENQIGQIALGVKAAQDAGALPQAVSSEFGSDSVYSAYNLTLNVCGFVPETSAAVNIMFPYPNGAAADGLDYRVYKYDGGSFTAADTVKTAYGVIASVTSGGDFAVIGSSAFTDGAEQKLYVSVLGGNGAASGTVVTLNGAGGVTELILSPNDGYVIDFVVANGQLIEVTDNRLPLDDGSVSLGGVIYVGFVSKSVQAAEKASGIVDLCGEFIKNAAFPSENAADLSWPIWTAVAIAIAAAVVLTVVLYVKKRKKPNNN